MNAREYSANSPSERPALRVLSIVEGTSITGPIKPLIMFAGLMQRGGEGRPAVNLSLITTVRVKGSEYPDNLLLSGAAEAGVHVNVLRERRAWDLGVILQMCRVIEACGPHIVETHQVKCHFMLGQALLWRRLKKSFAWIAYHHGYTRANLKLRGYEMLDRWSLRKPDRVVTVCEPFAAELIRNGVRVDRISVIPNAVESRPAPGGAELMELRQRLGVTESDCVILSVGRLSPEKGHHDLLVAFRRLLDQVQSKRSLKLILLGDGPERQRLERAAAELGDRVRFLGHKTHVWPYYFIADIFALPSHSEGSPLVLFEAMAAGCATVATAVGGVPETVKDGVSAVLVPPQDIPCLQEALGALSADADRRARLAYAAHDTLKKFSPEAYRDRIWDVYSRVLRG